jgi:hypothetical protein
MSDTGSAASLLIAMGQHPSQLHRVGQCGVVMPLTMLRRWPPKLNQPR